MRKQLQHQFSGEMIVLQGLGNRDIMPKELNKINFNACMHAMAWAKVNIKEEWVKNPILQ
jgi:hypothetical protein